MSDDIKEVVRDNRAVERAYMRAGWVALLMIFANVAALALVLFTASLSHDDEGARADLTLAGCVCLVAALALWPLTLHLENRAKAKLATLSAKLRDIHERHR